jgi:DNA-directed RNA polymerase specialized sigma24 family protein
MCERERLNQLACKLQRKEATMLEELELFHNTERYLFSIFRKLYSSILRDDDCEDLISEAFEDALNAFDSTRQGRFLTLVAAVFINKCRNACKIRINEPKKNRAWTEVSSAYSPSLLTEQMQLVIKTALTREPSQCRLIIDANLSFQKIPDAETAKLLSIKYDRVRHIRHNNLCHMRVWLKENSPDFFPDQE